MTCSPAHRVGRHGLRRFPRAHTSRWREGATLPPVDDGTLSEMRRQAKAERAEAALIERQLDDPMLADVWGRSLSRPELRLPGTDSGRLVVRVEVLG